MSDSAAIHEAAAVRRDLAAQDHERGARVAARAYEAAERARSQTEQWLRVAKTRET